MHYVTATNAPSRCSLLLILLRPATVQYVTVTNAPSRCSLLLTVLRPATVQYVTATNVPSRCSLLLTVLRPATVQYVTATNAVGSKIDTFNHHDTPASTQFYVILLDSLMIVFPLPFTNYCIPTAIPTVHTSVRSLLRVLLSF